MINLTAVHCMLKSVLFSITTADLMISERTTS